MFNSARMSGELSRRSFERILLVKPSSLGDVIHALPVLHGLRQRYPKARIDWLIGSAFAELLAGHDELDELIPFDRRRFGRMAGDPRIVGEFLRFIRTLRARRYDLVVDLQGLLRTGFLAWATGAGLRIGFRNAREGAAMFYTHHLRVENPDSHAVDRNYLVAEMLGFADVPVTFNLPVSDAARSWAYDLLGEAGLGGDAAFIAVAPGARWETKVWPAERFAATIDRLQADDRTRCVLLGGKDEVTLCKQIADLCPSKPINLAGRTDLPLLAAVIELANVVLCQDSGVMHLAAALGKPLVCLIGPTNPLRTGPYHRLDDVVRLDLDCSPCYLRRLTECPHGHRCMKALCVEAVLDALRRPPGLAVSRRG